MYSRHQQKLIDRMDARKGMPRRRLLQGAGAIGLAALLRPTAVFAGAEDEDERLGPFGPWSSPVNLGPVVNTRFDDTHPGISKDGLSLYIASDRPGGVNGENPNRIGEFWVSQRASLDAPWETPINLDAFNTVPIVNNTPAPGNGSPNLSPDGHLMFFECMRSGSCGQMDLYVSRRANKHNDFGWQEPVDLGCVINSPQFNNAPTYFEDEETGIVTMYFASTRPGGPGAAGNFHIYVSTLGDDGSFGPAVLVPELSSTANETRTAIRRDGLEFFLTSNRPNGRIGVNDIWVSTRDSTLDLWSTPVNLGPTVNYPGYRTGAPALSWDGTTLYCYSDRPGGFGGRDLYVITRQRISD